MSDKVYSDTMEVAIRFDKQLRRDLDCLLQLLKDAPESFERNVSIVRLQEAIMWLGMDLKRMNDITPGASPNPYPESKNPASLRIDPTADGLKL